jgi:hypothetical protein
LNMVYQGTAYSFAGHPGLTYDGTTDGQFNYTVDRSTGNVFRLDRQWQSPSLLCSVGANARGGIAYNRLTSSLFVEGQAGMTHEYALSGTLIASHFFNWSFGNLAADVDGTLWGHAGTTLHHLSSTGAYLGSFGVDLGNSNDYIFGAEINAVPEPSTLGLLGLGAAGLIRRRRTAYQRGANR